jgi:hypothetical protein
VNSTVAQVFGSFQARSRSRYFRIALSMMSRNCWSAPWRIPLLTVPSTSGRSDPPRPRLEIETSRMLGPSTYSPVLMFTRVMRWISVRIVIGSKPRLEPPRRIVAVSVLWGSMKSSLASSLTTRGRSSPHAG